MNETDDFLKSLDDFFGSTSLDESLKTLNSRRNSPNRNDIKVNSKRSRIDNSTNPLINSSHVSSNPQDLTVKSQESIVSTDSSDQSIISSDSSHSTMISIEHSRDRIVHMIEVLQKYNGVDPTSLPQVSLPNSLKDSFDLKPFQEQGYGWLRSMETYNNESNSNIIKGGILADYMGLGKTRMMIALVEGTKYDESVATTEYKQRHKGSCINSKGTLIICPVSLMKQWAVEIEKCTSFITDHKLKPRILFYYGYTKKKKNLFDIASYDYIITSYNTLARENMGTVNNNNSRLQLSLTNPVHSGRKLTLIHFHRIILDEAHIIRNKNIFQNAVLNLQSHRRWALTGTPIQNRIRDLFGLFSFLEIPLLGEIKYWNQCIHQGSRITEESIQHMMDKIIAVLSKIMLRRKPTTLINNLPILQLPLKTELVINIELSKEERDIYNLIVQKAKTTMNKSKKNRSNKHVTFASAFVQLTRTRQCLLHPYIVFIAEDKIKHKHIDNNSTASTLLNLSKSQQKKQSELVSMEVALDSMAAKLKKAGTEFKSNIIEKIKSKSTEEEECIICLDILSEPAILPCAHFYCYSCISQALKASSKCPLCKIHTRLNQIICIPTNKTITDNNHISAKRLGSLDTTTNSILMNADRLLSNMNDWTPSSKMKSVLTHVQSLLSQDTNSKIIIFSFYVEFLSLMHLYLNNNQVSSLIYHGRLSISERNKTLLKFQPQNDLTNDHSQPSVLLASLTTCNAGLNLTFANHAIIIEPSWNPAMDEQAINRIYRIGQTKDVTITYFRVLNSVDESVFKLAEEKRLLGERIVDCEANRPHLTGDALWDLFDIDTNE